MITYTININTRTTTSHLKSEDTKGVIKRQTTQSYHWTQKDRQHNDITEHKKTDNTMISLDTKRPQHILIEIEAAWDMHNNVEWLVSQVNVILSLS